MADPERAAAAEAPAEGPAVAVAPAATSRQRIRQRKRSELEALATALPTADGRAKRERKVVEVFTVEEKKPAETAAPAQGKGTKVGEIPNSRFRILKLKTDDDVLTGLHSLMYKRPGKAHERKKNIFDFSGFVFSSDEERAKLRTRLELWTNAVLHDALDAFDLPRGSGPEGQKSAKVARLLAFLEEPRVLSSKDLAAEAAKAKEKAARKREREAAAKDKGKAAKKAPAGKKARKADDSEGESEQEGSELGDESEPGSEEGRGGAKRKAAAKQPASGSTAPARKRQKAASNEGEQEEAADTPARSELRGWLDPLLAAADVHTMSMKQLMAGLVEQHGAGVKAHKEFIRAYVGDYCARKLAEAPQPGAGEAKEEEADEPPAEAAQQAQPAAEAPAVQPAEPQPAAAEQPGEAAAPASELTAAKALSEQPAAATAPTTEPTDVEMGDQ